MYHTSSPPRVPRWSGNVAEKHFGGVDPAPVVLDDRRLLLPAGGTRIGQSGVPRYTFDFPPLGYQDLEDVLVREPDRSEPADMELARAALEEGPYRRSWACRPTTSSRLSRSPGQARLNAASRNSSPRSRAPPGSPPSATSYQVPSSVLRS